MRLISKLSVLKLGEANQLTKATAFPELKLHILKELFIIALLLSPLLSRHPLIFHKIRATTNDHRHDQVNADREVRW